MAHDIIFKSTLVLFLGKKHFHIYQTLFYMKNTDTSDSLVTGMICDGVFLRDFYLNPQMMSELNDEARWDELTTTFWHLIQFF